MKELKEPKELKGSERTEKEINPLKKGIVLFASGRLEGYYFDNTLFEMPRLIKFYQDPSRANEVYINPDYVISFASATKEQWKQFLSLSVDDQKDNS